MYYCHKSMRICNDFRPQDAVKRKRSRKICNGAKPFFNSRVHSVLHFDSYQEVHGSQLILCFLIFSFFKSLAMGQSDSRPLPAQFALAPGGADTERALPRDVLLMVLDRVEGLATFAACLRSCRLFYNHLNREQAWARQLALVAEREFPGRTEWTGYQLEPIFLVSSVSALPFSSLSLSHFVFFHPGRRLGFFSQLGCGDWHVSRPSV